MKLMLTVETFKSGDKHGVVWASATGVDALGRRARAAFRDPREGDGRKRATAMIEQMAAAVPPGQDVADIRPIVECFGSWRDRPLTREGKPVMRGGEQMKDRYFEVASFNLLSGPALELRRTKQRACEVVDAVAAAMQAGDASKAAETALEFLRLFSGRPADEIDDVDADEPDAIALEVSPAPDAVDLASAAESPEIAAVEAPQADVPAAEQVVAADVRDLSVGREAAVDPSSSDVEPMRPAAEAAAEVSPHLENGIGTAAAGTAEVESFVAAVEAAPPVHPEPEAGTPAAPARAAPSRPDLGKAPPLSAAAPRQPLPPRAPPVAPRPAAAPAVRPVMARPPVQQAAPTRPAVQPPAQRTSGVEAPQRNAAPASEPRVAPTAAIAPPSGGYRRPEPGEDPEALAAAHLARKQRPGMPQAVRPAPIRPGVR
ncbi:hypothetical protein BHAOGJBA_5142 [Methylobacterium hispanicum]|uniref:Uncharacterized protein n=1 Tax=Methylobacterium hispanicum TaxID=270350 RepID=A0AAV4ZSP4_9HYPH|nr:hypothetical protein [Methylobacterium hispanicum]GJD91594.1 hypothetical protein BHAOGJBA_5142 [Methylobacterium hispanicum]